jgi:hypothetical protein
MQFSPGSHRRHINDLLTDGYTDSGSASGSRKNTKGQVMDAKVTTVVYREPGGLGHGFLLKKNFLVSFYRLKLPDEAKSKTLSYYYTPVANRGERGLGFVEKIDSSNIGKNSEKTEKRLKSSIFETWVLLLKFVFQTFDPFHEGLTLSRI